MPSCPALCQAPAVRGRARCRKHGGAPGSGAPVGNRNALRHGAYSAAAIARRRALRELLGQAAEFLERRRRE
jgi:glucans biosynthesis protein